MRIVSLSTDPYKLALSKRVKFMTSIVTIIKRIHQFISQETVYFCIGSEALIYGCVPCSKPGIANSYYPTYPLLGYYSWRVAIDPKQESIKTRAYCRGER